MKCAWKREFPIAFVTPILQPEKSGDSDAPRPPCRAFLSTYPDLADRCAVSVCASAAPEIVLASTTSVQDSGLLGRILPAFTQATGIDVQVVAQGTGQAIETGKDRLEEANG
jgi:hypothetical protein